MTSDPTNVVIIGGGPAGSAVGCYLSKAGIKDTIFEAANGIFVQFFLAYNVELYNNPVT